MIPEKCTVTIFFLSFIFFCSDSLGQAPRNVIGLENGKEIAAGKVRLRSPVFGKMYIEADGEERYNFEEVAYFQNEDGFFEKLVPPGMFEPDFLKREIHGPNISAYSQVSTYTSYQPAGPGMMGGPVMHSARLDYYSRGGEPLKKMTFKNLRIDLADNALSGAELKKVTGLRIVTGVLYAAGAGMLIGGISSTMNKQNDDPTKDSGVSPLVITGAISLALPWLVFRPIKRKKMLEAVRLYNH